MRFLILSLAFFSVFSACLSDLDPDADPTGIDDPELWYKAAIAVSFDNGAPCSTARAEYYTADSGSVFTRYADRAGHVVLTSVRKLIENSPDLVSANCRLYMDASDFVMWDNVIALQKMPEDSVPLPVMEFIIGPEVIDQRCDLTSANQTAGIEFNGWIIVQTENGAPCSDAFASEWNERFFCANDSGIIRISAFVNEQEVLEHGIDIIGLMLKVCKEHTGTPSWEGEVSAQINAAYPEPLIRITFAD